MTEADTKSDIKWLVYDCIGCSYCTEGQLCFQCHWTFCPFYQSRAQHNFRSLSVWKHRNSVFSLSDTETNTEVDRKRFEQNCVEVFILFRDRYQHRFPLGSVTILSVSVSDSVLVSDSLNVSLLWQWSHLYICLNPERQTRPDAEIKTWLALILLQGIKQHSNWATVLWWMKGLLLNWWI